MYDDYRVLTAADHNASLSPPALKLDGLTTPGARRAEPLLRDRRLVERCLSGDAAAWAELFDRYQPLLLRTVQSRLSRSSGTSELAEEIAGRVWHAILADNGQLLDRFDVGRGCSLGTYLSMLAVSELLGYLRSERRRRARDRMVGRAEASRHDSPAAMRERLVEFMRLLSPKERAFCEKHLLATADESASDAPISPAAVWQMRHRVRSKLNDFLDPT